ncbi:hypothetical protein [Flavobacterium sp. CLA17]|uniref:hypothetical protein n=1 Tax=Flavobacterium sp. CLA17 TaxID=2724135 RepID=UPI001490D855|nr:hypothetical protein [Flavobacterium sp. CLA17]QSB26480.1 hypothetical protein HAV12_019250 [Flavobacterium sp. CLA17]
MVNIKFNVLLIALIICGCNFFQEKKTSTHNKNKYMSVEKTNNEHFLLRNVTDSVLRSLYPDSTQNFFSGEKNFFSVYKYSTKNASSTIYHEVLKKEYDLNDLECTSRFKETKIKLIPDGINLAVFEDSSIKYNSYPGNQKVLFLNKKNNTVSLYLSDSLVFSNNKTMNIFINVRDKIFVSTYDYNLNGQFFIKKSEKLYKNIE